MKPIRPVVVSAGVVAVAAAGIAVGGAGTAQAAQSCGFEFMWTRPSVLPPQVLAVGNAQCTVPPEEHIVMLKLEFQPAGGSRWGVTSATQPDRRIPNHDARYEVSAPCYAGTWRAGVEIWGSIRGNPFTFSDRSGSVDVPASKCAPRG